MPSSRMRSSCLVLGLLTCLGTAHAAINFGTVTLPASATQTVTLTFPAAATLGTISVRTQGAENLDFTNAGGGTCNPGHPYAANATCTVEVTFTPRLPGLRTGAVVLLDTASTPNAIATAYLQGTGTGPRLSFPTTTLLGLDYNCGFPTAYVADGNNNAFIGDTDSGAIYLDTDLDSAICTTLPRIASLGGSPGLSLAVDGAGNIYVSSGSSIFKETPTSATTWAQSQAATGFGAPSGIAVDGAGNIYVCDQGTPLGGSENPMNPTVYKLTLQADGSYVKTSIGSNWSRPQGIAVDAAGNLYVIDHSTSQVVKETPSGSTYTQSLIVSSFIFPSDIAVDGNGDLYVSQDYDFPFDDGTGAIYELVPQSNGTYAQNLLTYSDSPESLSFDPAGNLLIADSYGFTEALPFSTPAALSFPDTIYGQTSASQSVTLSNSGNTPLTISRLAFPVDFPGTQSFCQTPVTLAPGATCNLSVTFKPSTALSGTTPHAFTENLTITTNSLNQSSAQQQISLSGTQVAPTVATPVITPPQGSYSTPQSIQITDSTPGAVIHYTTDGSTPTASSAAYTGPISLSGGELHILAIAFLANYNPSQEAYANYQFIAQTPTFSPSPGTYPVGTKVTISDGTPGAQIWYNLNQGPPSPNGSNATLYTGPIPLTASATVNAVALSANASQGYDSAATYTIVPIPPPPTFSLRSGTYNSVETLTITDATPGVSIYYTWNGSTPTTASPKYTAPITIQNSCTVRAIAVASNVATSSLAIATYNLVALPPVFSLPGGTYTTPQTVTLTTPSQGVKIFYTTKGNLAGVDATLYTGPITISASEKINAVAAQTGFTASPDVEQTYYIATKPAATPVFSLPAGTYHSIETLTISAPTPNSTIYYTNNGTTPTTASTKYTGPITVKNSWTTKAIAVAPGYLPSALASATYNLVALPPVFSLPGGTYTTPQTVTLTTPSQGVKIFYTTKGNLAGVDATLYTGPITISASEKINAVAAQTGFTASADVEQTYYIATKPAATPVFSLPAGTYHSIETLTISAPTTGSTIYYTNNGTTPTTASTKYTGPITVKNSWTTKAIAVAPGYLPSALASATYNLVALPPVFSLPGGTYTTPQTVTLTTPSQGVKIFYTTKGNLAGVDATLYTGPITISASEKLNAVAAQTGFTASPDVEQTYIIQSTSQDKPSAASPPSGSQP